MNLRLSKNRQDRKNLEGVSRVITFWDKIEQHEIQVTFGSRFSLAHSIAPKRGWD